MEWSFEIIEHLISNLGFPICMSLLLIFYLGKRIDKLGNKIDKTNNLLGNHVMHILYRLIGEDMPEEEEKTIKKE